MNRHTETIEVITRDQRRRRWSAADRAASNSAEDLEQPLHQFVWLYNHHLPQKALGSMKPQCKRSKLGR